MKKFFYLFLAVLLVFGMTACGTQPSQEPEQTQGSTNTPETTEQTEAMPAEVAVTDMIGREEIGRAHV